MKTSKTTTAKITTGNEGWGFHTTLQNNLKLSDAQAVDAFDRAVRFTAKRLDMDLDSARRFLDSRLGRHLADQCHAAKSVEADLDALYGSWKRDIREFRSAAINTTDEAFYA